MKINYFAYGSNLASPRLFERLPAARLVCVAILYQHQLCFRRNDQGQSGKCDIDFTGNPDDKVYGVLYQLSAAEKQVLDGYETGGFGYRDKRIEVTTLAQDTVQAVTYHANDIDETQAPFHWYREHVLRGALEHNFPAHYIASFEAVISIDDPDAARASRELSIYRDNE